MRDPDGRHTSALSFGLIDELEADDTSPGLSEKLAQGKQCNSAPESWWGLCTPGSAYVCCGGVLIDTLRDSI